MLLSRTIPSFDALGLDVYHTALEHPRTVVFVNAFGISARITRPLAERVTDLGMNFVTWECRGAPGRFADPRARYTPDDHARDLCSVLDALDLPLAVLLGWCSGGEVALHAARSLSERIERLILVSPYLSFAEQLPTRVGTSLAEMIRMVADAPGRAAMFYEIMRRTGRDAPTLGLVDDPEMLSLVSAPFENGPDVLFRYAAMLAKLYDNEVERWCDSVRVPTLAIGGGRDLISHPDHVGRLARAMPRASSHVLEDADHYSLFRHAGLQRLVCAEAIKAEGKPARATPHRPRSEDEPMPKSEIENSRVLEQCLREHAAVEAAFVRSEVHASDGRARVAYVTPGESGAGTLRRALRLEQQNALGPLTLHEPASDLLVAQLNRRETDFLYQEIFGDNAYLRHGVELPAGASVVDVGANIGMFALFVARNCPGARIVCVEPFAELCTALRANAVIHGADMRVHQCALGSEPGTAELTFYRHNSVMSGYFGDEGEDRGVVRAYLTNVEQALDPAHLEALISERMTAEKRSCLVETLTRIVRSEGLTRIDLLKVDVEKAEVEVLRGIDEHTWALIRQVVIEAHDVGDRLESLRRELEARGFEVSIDQDAMLANTGCFNVYGVRPRTASALHPAAGTAQVDRYGSRQALATELFGWVRERLDPALSPEEIVFVDAIPRREDGAIDDHRLRRLRESGAQRAEAGLSLRTDTERNLAKLWCEILRIEGVTADTDFFEAGGKSLSAIRLVVKVEEMFGAPVLSPDTLFNTGRLRDVAQAIDEALASAAAP